MNREEKNLETLLDAVLNRLNDLKHSIGAMIHKIETEFETIHWPTFLDNFALISSHVSLFLISTAISTNGNQIFIQIRSIVDRIV